MDEAAFSDKLRREALKYITNHFSRHLRWRRAAAGLPWLADVAKWAARRAPIASSSGFMKLVIDSTPPSRRIRSGGSLWY